MWTGYISRLAVLAILKPRRATRRSKIEAEAIAPVFQAKTVQLVGDDDPFVSLQPARGEHALAISDLEEIGT